MSLDRTKQTLFTDDSEEFFYTYSNESFDVYDRSKEEYSFDLQCEICGSSDLMRMYTYKRFADYMDFCPKCLRDMCSEIMEVMRESQI